MSQYEIEDVTINICTVDRPEYLEACLESLITTTPPGVALNLLFNGTPQSARRRATRQIHDWNGPIEVYSVPQTVPLDESHNIALEMVGTTLVNFMGDDDIVLGPRLPEIITAFNQLDPEPVVVTTFARRIAGGAHNPKLGSYKQLGPTTIEQWRDWVEQERVFEMLWPGAVLNTEALRVSGGFEAQFNRSVDNRIFSKLALTAPVVSLTSQDFGYRIHQGSLSTSSWKQQNRHVRYVSECHHAQCQNRPEPTFAEFLADEAASPPLTRAKRRLRDRSRMHFRRGGALVLEGDRLRGIGNLAAAGALWPPAFIEKVQDQFARS